MNKRFKAQLKNRLRKFTKTAFEASIILTVSMGTALCFWCSI